MSDAPDTPPAAPANRRPNIYAFPGAGLTKPGDEYLAEDETVGSPPHWHPCEPGKDIAEFPQIVRRPLAYPLVMTTLAAALAEIISIMQGGGNPAHERSRLRQWTPRALAALKDAEPFLDLDALRKPADETPRIIT